MRVDRLLIAVTLTVAAWVCPTAAAAQRVTGAGQKASELFSLRAGLLVFELEHNGDGAFVVRLLDDHGALVDTLARTAGSFRGSRAVRIPRSGKYLYDVLADGSWTVAPRPSPEAPADDRGGPVPASAASSVASSSRSTTDSIAVEATIDAEQAARRKGASRWMLGGLAGGTLLGPLGAGLVYAAANKTERAPLADVEARRAAHGDAYAETFARTFQAKRRSNRRVAALVGGATGTVVFGFIIAQIVNWSRDSGGAGGPGTGELP